MEVYKPKVVCFSCKFGWGYLADQHALMTATRRLIPTVCVGKIDSTYILDVFKSGADGVLILGCPEEHCHFQDGNFQAGKRVYLLQKVLAAFGIEQERLRIEFSHDPDGKTIPNLVDEMEQNLAKLGPVKAV